MEKIEIKLKECCLECESFSPDGVIGLMGAVTRDGKRAISCGHMAVCAKYNDAVPVVRCKDCAWRRTGGCPMQYACEVCGGQWSWGEDDGFCSAGKAKVE